jgi:phosphoribosylglycinamide synthetase, ATP-grasp, putative|nr:ATP-grasp domain-containing protein [uncultured Campylobacter sp.]
MKVALVIGASSESLYAINLAQENGLKVAAFDGDENAAGLKQADFSFVCDIRDPQNIINLITEQGFKPVCVLPVPVGRCLRVGGVINDFYGLKGPDQKECDVCTDKLAFHSALNPENKRETNGLMEPNLRGAECYLMNKASNLPSDADFPLVVKPRYGSGSKDVTVVLNASEYEKYAAQLNLKSDEFLRESFIKGEEYGINAAVIEGEYIHVLARKKLLTPPPYRQSVGYVATPEIAAISERLKAVIKRLELKNCLMHADVILRENGEPFVIELAPRPSGHYLTSDFVEIATGVNLTREWLNFVLNKPFSFEPKFLKSAIIRYFDFDYGVVPPNFSEIKDECGIVKFKCGDLKNLDEVKDGASLISRGYAIIMAESEEECLEKANALMIKFIRIKE